MCIAAPGKVIKIKGKVATVAYDDHVRNKAVIVDIVPHPDDYVLVQMGIIIKVLNKSEAESSQDAWKVAV